MEVVLGVAVTGRVARLALVGAAADGGQVYDQYALDLPDDAVRDLFDTIVGTHRSIVESGSRLTATRLYFDDPSEADTLRHALLGAGVTDVDVVSEANAATALIRRADPSTAVLLVDDHRATLTRASNDGTSPAALASVPIGVEGPAAACAMVLGESLGQPGPPSRVVLVSHRADSDADALAESVRQTSPITVEVPPDASFALARGAAQWTSTADAGAATQLAPAAQPATQVAPAAQPATQLAPAAQPATQLAPAAQSADQLAYSQEEPAPASYDEMPMDSLGDFVPEQDADATAYTPALTPGTPRMLLVGSAVAFAVVSFATLAVTVAINVRPASVVSEMPTQAVKSDTIPGNYLPPVPHQADPVALPVTVLTPPPAAPAPVIRPNRNSGPAVNAPAAPVGPPAGSLVPPAEVLPPDVPAAPGVPAVPVIPQLPVLPLPMPPIVVYPTWSPPTFPSTPSTTPPTSSTSPPTSTSSTSATSPPTTTAPTSGTSSTPSTPSTSITSSKPATTPPSPVEPSTPVTTQAPAYTPPSVPSVIPSSVPVVTAPSEPVNSPPSVPANPAPIYTPTQAPEAPRSSFGGGGSGAGSGSAGGSSSGRSGS